MRTKLVIVSLCAAALAVSSGSAQTGNTQSNSASKEKRAQEPKKICKWLPATGSNRVERHCLTADEWKKAEALAW